MYRVYILLALLLPGIDSYASRGINFREDLSWPEAKALAAKEGKMIFIDFYTSYCVPCKTVDKQVFTVDSVIKLMNDRFICLKLQMDSTRKDTEFINKWRKQAWELANRYNVAAYPTFVFLDADGDAIHKFSSACTAPEFYEVASKTLSPEAGYYANLKRYTSGNRDPEMLAKLINGAVDVGDPSIDNYVTEYFRIVTKDFNNTYWTLALKYPTTERLITLLKHSKEVNQLKGKGTAEAICFPLIYEEITKLASNANGDRVDWNEYDALVKARYGNKANEILAFSKVWQLKDKSRELFPALKQYLENYKASISDHVTMKLCSKATGGTYTEEDIKYLHEWMSAAVSNTTNPHDFYSYASFLSTLGDEYKIIMLEYIDKAIIHSLADIRFIYTKSAEV